MFVSEEQVEDFAKFLKKIFKWQPEKRWSAKQLLSHQWLTREYPEDDDMEFNRDEIIRLEIEDEEEDANRSLLERIFFCFSHKGKSE